MYIIIRPRRAADWSQRPHARAGPIREILHFTYIIPTSRIIGCAWHVARGYMDFSSGARGIVARVQGVKKTS